MFRVMRLQILSTAAAVGLLFLGGCSAAASPSALAVPAGTATATAPSSGGVTGASSTPSAQVGRKVNANTATLAELQAAFEAAGIPNAARWAREVDEYRPYPTDDPSFSKLRRELAKYNPSPETVEKIISALSL